MMKKIDGHLHLVRSLAGLNGKGRLTPLGGGRAIWDDGEVIKLIPDGWGDDHFLVDAALKVMDNNGIEKAVLLQGSLNGYQNYYSWQVAKKYPQRFMTSFSVDPFARQAMTIVKRYVEQLGVRVMKFEISQGGGLHGYHRPFWLDQDERCSRIFHFYLITLVLWSRSITAILSKLVTNQKPSPTWRVAIPSWTLWFATYHFPIVIT